MSILFNVLEWISSVITHFTEHVITYPSVAPFTNMV